MAKIRNTMDGKKRQASVLGSTLTSLTFESEESDTSSEEVSDDDDTYEEDEAQNKNSKSGQNVNCDEKSEKKQLEKDGGKPRPKSKVRMKTLTIDGHLVYFCVICDKIFTRKKDKVNHELAHSSNETLLSCPECGKEYVHESSLAHHIRTHDGEQLHFCDLCPKLFAQSHQLKAHVLSHSQPTEFSCKVCLVDFDSAADLKSHHRTKVKEEITALWCDMCQIFCCRPHCIERDPSKFHAFQCTACNELFYTQKKLRLHTKKFAHKSLNQPQRIKSFDEKDHSAKEVIKTSSSNVDIEQQLGHCSEGQYGLKAFHGSQDPQGEAVPIHEDKECDTEVKFKIEFSRKAYKKKPYCKKCNMSFKDSCDLVSHKLSSHYETTSDLICPVCGQESASSTDLEQHMNKHKMSAESSTIQCKLCCKMFTSKVQLVQHEKLHGSRESDCINRSGGLDCGKSGVFECPICSKAFSSHQELQNHLRLHNNIKSFQCYICQKIFVTKHYLQLHLQTHVQDGSFIQSEGEDDVNNGNTSKDTKPPDFDSATGKGNDDTLSRMKMEVTGVGNNKTRLDFESSLKSELDTKGGCNFSEGSVCSSITKDSERSNGFQFSSDTSQSFKISMAKERRKFRKRKLSLKSLMHRKCKYARPTAGTGSLDDGKPILLSERLKEEDDIQIEHLTVEINGVRSEADEETTICVELKFAKQVPKLPSLLMVNEELDKENKLPSTFNDKSFHATEYLNTELSDGGLKNPMSVDKASHCVSPEKLLVLDLELNDSEMEKFVTRHESNVSPSKTPTKTLINSEDTWPSNTHLSNVNEKSKSCSESVSGGFSCLYNKSPLEKTHAQYFKSNVKKDMTDVQPLHSLHLMTVKLDDDDEKNKDESVSRTPKKEQSGTKHNAQNERHRFSSSAKTCRDIAASWKSNKNSNINQKATGLMGKSVKQTAMVNLNENINIFNKQSYDNIRTNSLDVCESESSNVYCRNSSSQRVLNNSEIFGNLSAIPSSSIYKSKDSENCLSQSQSSLVSHQHKSPSSVPSSISNPTAFNVIPTGPCSNGSIGTSHQGIPNPQAANSVYHFDTENPALRNMNLMDMVNSIQTSPTTNKSPPDAGNPFNTSLLSQNANPVIGLRNGEQNPESILSPPGMFRHSSQNPHSQLGQSSQLNIFGNKTVVENNLNTPNAFINRLPPLNLNSGVNVNPNPSIDHFNKLNLQSVVNNDNATYGALLQTNWSGPPSFNNRAIHQDTVDMSNMLPQLTAPGCGGVLGRSTYNIKMESFHLNNSSLQHGQPDFINASNPSHFGFNTFPPGVVTNNSIPLIPKIRTGGETFMGHVDHKPFHPSLPLAYNHPPIMPVFQTGFASVPPSFPTGLVPAPPPLSLPPPNILPNTGFVQMPHAKLGDNINTGVLYLPF